MLDTLTLIGFKEPSPIQQKAIPVAMSGKDIIGQAQTGTGKTASFGIPIIEMTKPGDGIQHIVLAPSRELATQIYNELHKLSANKGIKVIDIIGGISYSIQKKSLNQNPDIIVATPGRYIDNLEKGLINHSNVKTFTLDEADEMLNFGFYKEIKKIRDSIKNKIQTFFFTATFNDKIKKLAKELLHSPIEITISEGLSVSEKIDQKHIMVQEKQKLTTLVSLLQLLNPNATLIFGRTKRRVDELSSALKTLGFNAMGIQGDMSQRERGIAMKSFRSESINILIGTDVMARGIDVDNIDYVFNFDLPTELENYTHRIGRTGRAGKKGIAISFVKQSEKSYFNQIMKLTSSTSQEWPIPTENDLKEVKAKQLDRELANYLKIGKNRFKMLGANIAKQYTKDELGIIIAQISIGNVIKTFDIKLTGETSVMQKSKSKQKNNRKNGNKNTNKKYTSQKRNFSKNRRRNFNNKK